MQAPTNGRIAMSLAIAALLVLPTSATAVSIYDEGFNWFQAESDILVGEVNHCDGFLRDTALATEGSDPTYCDEDEDGDGASERAGFYSSATGPLLVHAVCRWDIWEPLDDGLAEMVVHVEWEGSQTVCSKDYNRTMTHDATEEAAWEKSGILGVETNRTVTDWLNHTDAHGTTETLDTISWSMSWVVGGVQDEAATLEDPSGDDHYSVTSPDAARWGIKDPSGDDHLEGDDGGEIEVEKGTMETADGVLIEHKDLEGDAEEWIFTSEDGSPIGTDLLSDGDGREAVTYTYS